MKSFQNNNSPVNDGLTKEFYYAFWDEMRQPFMNLMSESKSLEKPNKDKRFICNWRQVSLLNFDQKTISKALAA